MNACSNPNAPNDRPIAEVIIPVLDLKNKQVVHATRGERDRYQPIQSLLVTGSEPRKVAEAIRDETGCRQFYVADLDSIEHQQLPDTEVCQQLISLGLTLLLDADWSRIEKERIDLSLWEGIRPIVSSECLGSVQQLEEVYSQLAELDPIFGLDMEEGRVRMRSSEHSMTANPLMIAARKAGFSSTVILDLASVGSGGGPNTIELIQRLRLTVPEMELVSGGGVRNRSDVDDLVTAGCGHVLVATAIHEGKFRQSGFEER